VSSKTLKLHKNSEVTLPNSSAAITGKIEEQQFVDNSPPKLPVTTAF
jgi:hypothetical protein